MFDFFVQVSIICSTIFYNPRRIDGEEILSFMLMVFFAVYALMTEKKRSVSVFLPALMVLLALYTNALKFFWPSYEVTINMLVFLFAMKCIAERITLDHKVIGKAFIVHHVISLTFICIQYFSRDIFYNPVYKEVAGTSLLPWVLGCTAAISVPFVAAVSPWLCLLIVLLLWFGKSKFCFAVGVAAFGLLYFRWSKKYFAILLASFASAAIGYALMAQDKFSLTRVAIWKGSFKYIKNYFWGNGIGSWAHTGFISHAPGDMNYHWRTAHNEFYQHFFEQGGIGLTLLLIWLLIMFLRCSPRTKIALFTISALSCIHPIFHFGRTTFILSVILAFAVGESYDKARDYKNQKKKRYCKYLKRLIFSPRVRPV